MIDRLFVLMVACLCLALAPCDTQAQPTLPNDVLMAVSAQPRGGDQFLTVQGPYQATADQVITPVTLAYAFPADRVAYGQVLPGLTRFFGLAESPVTVDNPDQGSQVVIDVRRSFSKLASDATLSYSYSAGVLELKNYIEQSRRCQASRCMYAEVTAYAAVLDDQARTVWFEQKSAALYLENGEFKVSIGSVGSGGGLRNPDWSWTPDYGPFESTFTLDGKYTAAFDLASIEVGRGFTANYVMVLTAVDTDRFLSNISRAYAIDPISGSAGDQSGFELASANLLPVPEPLTILLMAVGLVGLGGHALRNRRRAPVLG
jgi:hypothetical protein